MKVVDLSADFRLRDLGGLRGVVRRARRRRSSSPRPSTGCPSSIARRIARRRPRRRPWLLPDRGDPALAPLRGHLSDVVIDAKTGCPAPGAGRHREDALRLGRRERQAYGVGAPPPHAGDRPGAGGARGRANRAAFTPHLFPLDQGELVSCYVTPNARGRRPSPLYEEAYARRAFVDVVDAPARRARRARDEPLPHPRPRPTAHRQGLRLRRDRQPVEGHGLAGGAVPEPDVRLRRGRGVCCDHHSNPFFRSRWVDVPDGVARGPGRALPQGFRAAGVAAGIKPSGGLDVGLLVSDAPETDQRRALHRARASLAPPVLVTQERAQARRAPGDRRQLRQRQRGDRAIAGMDEAARMQGAGGDGLRRATEDRSRSCSTGVIGVQLDGQKVVTRAAGRQRGADGRRRSPTSAARSRRPTRSRSARRSRSSCRAAPSGWPRSPRARA